MRIGIINHSKSVALLLLTMLLTLIFAGCAFIPRSKIDSDAGVIIESQTVSGKYKIYIYPIDAAAVADNSASKYLYKIGPHDQLSVTVWGHPEFSSPTGTASIGGIKEPMAGNYTYQINQSVNETKNQNKMFFTDPGASSVYNVDEDGNIFLPLLGPIKVIQKTPKQVRAEVKAKLTDYVVNPQVNVAMYNYRSRYAYVLGEISQPSVLALNDVPLDLAAALSMTGWVNLTAADVKNIYVLRQGSGTDIKVYRLDATMPTSFVYASGFVLQPLDVVFVSTAGLAQFDRVMTHLLNTAEIIWYVRTAVAPTGNFVPGQW